MRKLALLVTVVIASCAGPEPGDTGYVVLDEEARAAGLVLDTGDGNAPHASALPIAVSARSEVALVGRDGERAPLVVAPGETVEVKDGRGTLVRGHARADRLVLSGGRANAMALAQMLGATVVERSDGRVELAGDDVLLAAALYGDVEGIDAVSVLLTGAASESAAPWILGQAAPEQAASMPVSEGRIGVAPRSLGTPGTTDSADIDPASLVGLYEAHGVTLLVDAAGGYTLHGNAVQQHGAWSVRGGRLYLIADGATDGASIGVGADANSLMEDSGVVLRASGSGPRYIIHDPVRTAFGSEGGE